MTETANRATPRIELRLLDAIVRWCDQDLIWRIRRKEMVFTLAERRHHELPSISREEPPAAALVEFGPQHRPRVAEQLHWLWDVAADDFKERLKARELFIRAVPITNLVPAESISIPVAWVPVLRVSVAEEVIGVGDQLYGDILVSDHPWPAPRFAGTDADPPPAVTLVDVPALSDEMVLMLLEEHAERVVRNDSRMMDPRRISLTPIILRKLEHRAQRGEMLDGVHVEAQALHAWVKARLVSFQVPSPLSIENGIRAAYRHLNPRSKPIIKP